MTTRRFSVAALVLWLCAFALTLYIANVTGVPGFDMALAEPAHAFAVANGWSVWVARFFAAMGSGFVLAPLTVGIVVALWIRGQRWWALFLGAAGVGGILISQGVKRLVDRQRPEWDNPLHELTSPSFPSGHAMAGIYGYFAFGIVAWFLVNRAFGVALMAFGLLMGPSRVVFGVHWPTDVLAGWLFAGAWLCTVAAVLWWRLGPPPTGDDARVAEVAEA
jgi:undecaprenyl-diphosphatase